ncbi:hypothetical protein MBLNU459_g6028t1 [Dothideomycetes sp. NU459]
MSIFSKSYAQDRDSEDPLRHLRNEFKIPPKKHLMSNFLAKLTPHDSVDYCTYLCGNSLGLQPSRLAEYQQKYHDTWAQKGVYGHFTEIENSPLAPWLDVDDDVQEDMANIVGANKDEVAVMQTLTGNLHLAMCSFYRPSKERYKIILEGKAFPSDHYAIESQIRHHNLDPTEAMIMISPNTPMRPILSTQHILRVIDEHASDTALLLLPGIQFYTGQFFDIPTITAHAQKKGIMVGWDLAHAVGNVPVSLHSWNVDFAAWCNYKYMNSGPGAIGGLFIHERHGTVTKNDKTGMIEYRPRLSGWWGSDKSSRFAMENKFTPIPGAGGWQLSNPSVADMTALRASLDTFKQTTMEELREKSLKLTKYLEDLLHAVSTEPSDDQDTEDEVDDKVHKVPRGTFEIITPSLPKERGAQLSVRLAPGLLDHVMAVLEEKAVVVDERRPDVIRVAPAPLYNNHVDVLRFVKVFSTACVKALEERGRRGSHADKDSVMIHGGQQNKGWSEIK